MSNINDPQSPALVGGQPAGATTTVGLPLNAAGTALLTEPQAGVTGAKTQIVDAAGTHTQPAGDAAARPIFTELSDGAAALGTAGNPLRTLNGVVAGSTDAGHDIATGVSATQGGSQATTNGYAWFSTPLANTAAIYLGKGSGVTTGIGIELQPDRAIRLACANTSEWWTISGSASQHCHVVAE